MGRARRRGPHSLRRRLTGSIVGASFLVWAVSLAVVLHVAWDETSDAFDDSLKEGARLAFVLGAALQRNGSIEGDDDTALPKSARAKIYYQLVSDDGRVLRHAAGAPAKPFSDDLRRASGMRDVWADGQAWRVYVLRGEGRGFQVQVGQPWEERLDLLDEVAEALAYPALALAAMLGGFTWWLIRRLLRPLERTAQRIAAKSKDDLQPVPTEREPQELLPIVDAFNLVLSRLDRALQSERRFTADAAHELRTPLSALRMRIQLLQRQRSSVVRGSGTAAGSVADHASGTAVGADADSAVGLVTGRTREYRAGDTADSAADDARSLAALRDEVDRCTALVDSLLALARLDPQRPQDVVLETVDLRALFDELASQLRAELEQATDDRVPLSMASVGREHEHEIHDQHESPDPHDPHDARLSFDTRVDAVRAHPALLRSALRNLIDNALRYGTATTRVRVEATSTPEGVVRIAVLDDGPGVPEPDRARLGERFFRVLGTERSGSGLGLSIVARVAALHGARLSFGEGLEGRGLGVTIAFPARRPD